MDAAETHPAPLSHGIERAQLNLYVVDIWSYCSQFGHCLEQSQHLVWRSAGRPLQLMTPTLTLTPTDHYSRFGLLSCLSSHCSRKRIISIYMMHLSEYSQYVVKSASTSPRMLSLASLFCAVSTHHVNIWYD